MAFLFLADILHIYRDRRSLGTSQKPSGVLVGHTEGITYVSAKGDGRYIISNGKDQALRLWDLRKMRSNAEYEAISDDHYGIPDYDYRYDCKRYIGIREMLRASPGMRTIPGHALGRIQKIAVS